jgi:transposase
MDVHKKSVTACLLRSGASGRVIKEQRTFGTMTADLRKLAAWLQEAGCRHVAMESTGVYWRPVFNLLEHTCEKVLLINAQHIKHVPGRKTDMKDAEWIATLLRHGLLHGSFIPPPQIRELRELTRYRSTVIRLRADECNRLQKVLEAGNIKLASVASDVLGKSGREMLAALVGGEDDAQTLADMARGRLRAKIPQLQAALEGNLTPNQRWLLGRHLEQVAHLDDMVLEMDAKIAEVCRPFEAILVQLDKLPGVNRRIAQIIVAEIGLDMKHFPTADHLASWAGMCPGNHESAGKRQSGKTRKGSRYLKAALVEAGWATAHCKKNPSYLTAQYHRIARRRGKKRACVAVGHSLLIRAYVVLASGKDYLDLGGDYFDRQPNPDLPDHLVKRLQRLGYDVTINKRPAA